MRAFFCIFSIQSSFIFTASKNPRTHSEKNRVHGGIKKTSFPNRVLCGFFWKNEYILPYGIMQVQDIIALRYNSQGKLLWETTYNGPSNQDDFPLPTFC